MIWRRERRSGACAGGLRGAAATVALAGGLLGVAGQALPVAAQERIGVAASVVRQVTGNIGGSVRDLSVGEGVFADETVETGERSNSQLLFRDETTLSIGPSSAVVLDRFVYDPGGRASTFSVRAARGALRFVSGSSRPAAYEIETPVATIGVRGTIVDVFVFEGLVIVILTEGAADVCVNGRCSGLTRPGTYLVVRAGGQVEGPRPWDGRLRSVIGPVPFPLYGWHLDLDRGERFRASPPRLDATDQLEFRDIEVWEEEYTPPRPEPRP